MDLENILERHGHQQSALLPVLHAVQDELGYIPPEIEPAIADALGLSRAEVHGVITFYHHFRQVPVKHVVRVCCAEACQANGGEMLTNYAQSRASAIVVVEPVYCLGLCACGPAVQVNETTLHAGVTCEAFDVLLAELERVE